MVMVNDFGESKVTVKKSELLDAMRANREVTPPRLIMRRISSLSRWGLS